MSEVALQRDLQLEQLGGPVRSVAGAGTGKTGLLVSRVRDLVQKGVPPQRVLVMTFTERASNEMRARIEGALGEESRLPLIGTFHAVTQGWLREEGWRIGLGAGFRILAGPERWILLRELMWDLGRDELLEADRPDEMVGPLLKMLERLKQELIPVDSLRRWSQDNPDSDRAGLLLAAADLFDAYAAACARQRVLDFEDLISSFVRILEDFPEVRRAYGQRYGWILVDEYQDTNLAQERLVELLAESHRNVFVVGDDDQSIYRFRGASRASMERFLRRFPDAACHDMGVNLRSSGNIVAAARALIENNKGRLPKQIASGSGPGAPVGILEFPDGRSEAAGIARAIADDVRAGTSPAQVAVLVRTNALAPPIAAELTRLGVAHRVWGASGLYQQPEVKDVIAWLRIIAEPGDQIARRRLESRPQTGFEPPLLEQLSSLAAEMGVQDLLFELLNRSRLLERADGRGGPQRAQANLARFAELVDEYCGRVADQSLARYLGHLDLVLRSEVDEELPPLEADVAEPAVQLMTIHRAKGLEFDHVFIPALVEGRLPQPRRRETLQLPVELAEPAVRAREDHVAEERRLLYVAMTRARSRLQLSWAAQYEGARIWAPSRFLEEVRSSAGAVVISHAGPEPATPAVHPEEPKGARMPAATAPQHPALSFSAINTYRECPRQFQFRYAERLPAEQSVEAQYGTLIHLVLMEAGRRRQAGQKLTPDALREIEDEAWARVPIEDPRRARVLRRLASRHLAAYLAAGGLEAVPAELERPFQLDLETWSLHGVIDRIDPSGGGWKLIDYKSGAALPERALRRDLQLALYGLAARAALGLQPLELELVYLREGKRVQVAAGDELLDEAAAIGATVAERVGRQEFQPQPERRRCRRCPYRLACDAAL